MVTYPPLLLALFTACSTRKREPNGRLKELQQKKKPTFHPYDELPVPHLQSI